VRDSPQRFLPNSSISHREHTLFYKMKGACMDWSLLIPLAGIGMPVGIVWIVYSFENRNKEQLHATLRTMIESGQELTPDVIKSVPGLSDGRQKDKNDIRSGFVTSGTGIGLALLGHFGLGLNVVFGAGLLTTCIGLGMLSYGFYSKNKEGQGNDPF